MRVRLNLLFSFGVWLVFRHQTARSPRMDGAEVGRSCCGFLRGHGPTTGTCRSWWARAAC